MHFSGPIALLWSNRAGPQEEGNGAAAILTTPLERQQPEGSQLREDENAAPPASSVADQPQMTPTLARLQSSRRDHRGVPSCVGAALLDGRI